MHLPDAALGIELDLLVLDDLAGLRGLFQRAVAGGVVIVDRRLVERIVPDADQASGHGVVCEAQALCAGGRGGRRRLGEQLARRAVRVDGNGARQFGVTLQAAVGAVVPAHGGAGRVLAPHEAVGRVIAAGRRMIGVAALDHVARQVVARRRVDQRRVAGAVAHRD